MLNKENLYVYRAEYIRNYDGDTVTFMVDVGLTSYRKLTVRLYDVDTHELRSKDVTDKALAYEAKEFAKNFLKGKEIFIKTIRDKTGKYGRYLAHVYVDGVSLSKELRRNGYDTGRRF